MLRGSRSAAVSLVDGFRAASVWVNGATVALVGPVNAGKSTLFNALVGRERALVHDAPGTTRDVLEIQARVEGLAVRLLDTAGERVTLDPVEAAGLALARDLVEEADLLLVVVPAGDLTRMPVVHEVIEQTSGRPRLLVYNGVDRVGVPPAPKGWIPVSALKGEGLADLRRRIRSELVGAPTLGSQVALGSRRQRDRLQAAVEAAVEAEAALPIAGVAVAADGVTRALELLDELTGVDTRESVLDRVFERFCIGK